jgi:protein TonB
MPRTQDEVAQSTESRSASSTVSSTPNSSSSVRPSPPASDTHSGSLPLSSNHPSAVCVEVPLEIHGSRRSNIQGQPAEPFNEETFSVIVFPNGGIVRLEAAVIAGQMLAVTNRNSQRGILCRVTNVRNYPKLKSYVEVVFSQPAPGFWGVRFPDEGHSYSRPVETVEPQQAAQPSAQKSAPRPTSQPQLQAPRALPPSPPPKAAEPASAKLEQAAASLKSLAAELATAIAPPVDEPALTEPSTVQIVEAAVPAVVESKSEVVAAPEDESTTVIELTDEPETELSELVESLQDDSEVAAQPQAAELEAEPVIEAQAESTVEPEIEAVVEPQVESTNAAVEGTPLKDDFWSTSFPEEILNWAIETAAIPAAAQESTAQQPAVSAPAEKQKSSSPAQQATKSVGFTAASPAASKPAQAASTLSTVVPSQPKSAPSKSAQPAAAHLTPDQLSDRDLQESSPGNQRRESLWQKQAQQPSQKQQAAPPAPKVAAKQPAPAELDLPEPDIDDAEDPILESSMRQELERLALAHLDTEEDEISPEDDAKSIISAPAPRIPPRAASSAQQSQRPSNADRKALAARGRTRYNSATTLIPKANEAHASIAASRHTESEPDSIIVDENTAVLLRPLKPMTDGIPLGPLLGATQEYDAASVTQLTQGTSKRANMLVVGVAVVMLAVVGGGWWFFHHDATPARALPEPTGPVNSQPQPTGSYNQPTQPASTFTSAPASAPANTNVDSMDAVAAAALKAGANTTPADAAATSAPAHLINPSGSQPASSQPINSQPINSQPATSQPATSQPAATKPIASRPAGSQPLSSQPAASPPAASANPTARARASSPLPHDEDSESRSSSPSYTHKLLMPAVKLSAPKVEGRTGSSAAPSAPVIADGANSGSPAPGINGIVPNADASMPAPSAPVHTGISTVGGRVREPKLVARVTPAYPPEARQFNIQGTVTIDATIDLHGNVTGMRVISGPAALQRAAMDALKEWKYEPSTLNDRPVSVHTIVTIKFTR